MVPDIPLVGEDFAAAGEQEQRQGRLMAMGCSAIPSVTIKLDGVLALIEPETDELAALVVAIDRGPFTFPWS